MKIDINRISALPTANAMLDSKYGAAQSAGRERFESESYSWYYSQIFKDTRKAKCMTQQHLADMIGKKREYIAALEKGDTDMQLSTFMKIAEALGYEVKLVPTMQYSQLRQKVYVSDGDETTYGSK